MSLNTVARLPRASPRRMTAVRIGVFAGLCMALAVFALPHLWYPYGQAKTLSPAPASEMAHFGLFS